MIRLLVTSLAGGLPVGRAVEVVATRAADLATLSDGAARVCAHLHAGPVAHAVVRNLAHSTAVMHVLAMLAVLAVGRPPAAVRTPRVRES